MMWQKRLPSQKIRDSLKGSPDCMAISTASSRTSSLERRR